MARKTNKTAHVLNLISKAKDEHQTMDEQMEIDNTGSDVSNDLMFMGIEPSNDKSISEKINENLEAFVEEEDNLSSPVTEELPQKSQLLEKETSVEEIQEMATINANTDTTADVSVVSVPEPPIQPKDEKHETHSAVISHQEPPVETSKEHVFHYVNVYEKLVLERLKEFQTMFEVCSCPRCTADVIAIALTNLPAKYIVVDNPKIIPLLSFYREKFKTPVATQLSSACVTVKEKPLH
ncbi:Late competence development protein ComFB [anaerobic digester metagenome]